MGSNTLTALVTGASHDIGYEVVRALVERGFTVWLSARTRAKAEDALASLGDMADRVRPLALDIDDPASVQAAAQHVGQAGGTLDVLVNNAAVFADWSEPVSTANLGTAQAVVNTNLFGTWRVIQAFLPLLRASARPRIVNIGSGSGSHGDAQFGLTSNGGGASYAISKAALHALTAKLATELADTPILVNAVDPGLTATSPGMEQMGARPASASADGIVWAATLPDDGPRGGFFRDSETLAW